MHLWQDSRETRRHIAGIDRHAALQSRRVSAWPAAFVTPREITPQLLGPARFSLEALQRIAKDEALSTHMAAGQYQQRPTAREGGLFKRASFTRCHERDGSGQAPCRMRLTSGPASSNAELARCFLGLANLPNHALDRLSRYEATLWRRIRQILQRISGGLNQDSPTGLA